MPTHSLSARRIVVVQAALAALWIFIAVVLSLFAFHLAVNGQREADVRLAEIAGSSARMAEAMTERGHSASEAAAAATAAAQARGATTSLIPFPPGRSPDERKEHTPRYGFLNPDPGMGGQDGPMDAPSAFVHLATGVLVLRLPESPLAEVARAYVINLLILAAIAILVTWFVQDRMIRRALAPVITIEHSLRRLAEGEYSRLEIVGHEPGEAAVVDAYNAAADELASSIRRRAEAEANLRQFVAEAGHELRTPLTVIMGFVDILRQGAIAEQALAQRILESVASEGERMRSLIGKLLLLARLDAVAPDHIETVDLSKVVADTVDSFKPLAGTAALSADVEPGISVNGSVSELREVAGNLVDNAIKYAPESAIRVSVARKGRYAVITVMDNGPGMSPAMRARAFDRFSRGEDRASVPGSGLGLAIVRRIATRTGGDVDLESEIGKGTTVVVRLPLLVPQSESSPRSV